MNTTNSNTANITNTSTIKRRRQQPRRYIRRLLRSFEPLTPVKEQSATAKHSGRI